MRHLHRLAFVGAIATVSVGLGPTAAIADLTVSVPTVSLPGVTVPVPSVSVPVSVPTVSTPPVSVPAVTTPTVSTPVATVPPVSTPAISVPAVEVTPDKVVEDVVGTAEEATKTVTNGGGPAADSGPGSGSGSGSNATNGSGSTGSGGSGSGGSEAPAQRSSGDETSASGPSAGSGSGVSPAGAAQAGVPAGAASVAAPSSARTLRAVPHGAAGVVRTSTLGSSARFASNSQGDVDAYLLGLVHDDLCTALASMIGPLPPRIDGLPGPVVSRLPAEIRNVVPRNVLMGATIRCESTAFEASVAHVDPDTKLLALLARTGLMVMTFLQVGLGLLCVGAFIRHHAGRPRSAAPLTS